MHSGELQSVKCHRQGCGQASVGVPGLTGQLLLPPHTEELLQEPVVWKLIWQCRPLKGRTGLKGEQGQGGGCSHSGYIIQLICIRSREEQVHLSLPLQQGTKQSCAAPGCVFAQLLQNQHSLCSTSHGHARARVYPLLDELEINTFTVLLVEQSSISQGRTIISVLIHAFDLMYACMYICTPDMFFFCYLKNNSSLHPPTLTHYLSLNRNVLLIPVTAYSAQHIVWWYFPSLVRTAICFIIAWTELVLLTKKGHCPWLLEQMRRPSVCITQQPWELALPPTFLFQMSGVSEMCQGFRVVITSI